MMCSNTPWPSNIIPPSPSPAQAIASSLTLLHSFCGQSGCSVCCLRDERSAQVFVRKTAPCPGYNHRLQRQLLKQARFQAHFSIAAPQVLGSALLPDGRLYYDMEYIPSQTLAQQFGELSAATITQLLRGLCALIPQQGHVCPRATAIFAHKIAALRTSLDRCDKLDLAFNLLESFDWSHIPRTPCHGDLTLENILVSAQGKVFIIDFLDSFYNSWMIDCAKLLQDLELGWAYRYAKPSVPLQNALGTARSALLLTLRQRPDGAQELAAIYHVLLLNLVRIAPYAHDTPTLKFLDQAIPQVCTQLRTLHKGDLPS